MVAEYNLDGEEHDSRVGHDTQQMCFQTSVEANHALLLQDELERLRDVHVLVVPRPLLT